MSYTLSDFLSFAFMNVNILVTKYNFDNKIRSSILNKDDNIQK